MKNRITIGFSSILLILLILCLAVFSLLSLSDAKNALDFARRRASSVQAYYKVDAEAQMMLRDTVSNPKEPSASSVMTRELPMPSGQALHVEVNLLDFTVLSYYVYNSEAYTIDSRLPVWDGTP